ncbi:DUF803-domain-containing protein, partial [Fistulina hepatica ATCC 64428]
DAYTGIDLPEVTTSTGIGIAVAVTGNILISLALNLQKLAHKRLDELGQDSTSIPSGREPEDTTNLTDHGEDSSAPDAEQPLLQSLGPFSSYGIQPDHLPHDTSAASRNQVASRLVSTPKSTSSKLAAHEYESDYLKSRLWWTGFLLMNVGELGNFISYAYAPASVVAPLGTFALIANCFFAPLIIGERFHKWDVLGMFIAIIGAVTVVLSTKSSDKRLDPDALLQAMSRTPFAVYSCMYVAALLILIPLSHGPCGRRYAIIDVGICSLFGGFTVLATKATSTLLTMEWFEMFTHWITYPVILILVGTGLSQIRYLNRALMRFDGKAVIPLQFVLFNLSAITGSAILYGDFERAKFHQFVTFLYGCTATFAGVFLIAWGSPADSPSGHGVDSGRRLDGVHNLEQDSAAEAHDPIADRPIYFRGWDRRHRPSSELHGDVVQYGIPRNRHTSLGLLGITSAQPLLLVHTPPHEVPE